MRSALPHNLARSDPFDQLRTPVSVSQRWALRNAGPANGGRVCLAEASVLGPASPPSPAASGAALTHGTEHPSVLAGAGRGGRRGRGGGGGGGGGKGRRNGRDGRRGLRVGGGETRMKEP